MLNLHTTSPKTSVVNNNRILLIANAVNKIQLSTEDRVVLNNIDKQFQKSEIVDIVTFFNNLNK